MGLGPWAWVWAIIKFFNFIDIINKSIVLKQATRQKVLGFMSVLVTTDHKAQLGFGSLKTPPIEIAV
jgi:hypothetical protein